MAPGRKDITLTVGLELARIDAQARAVHDDLVRGAGAAGREAGQKFSSNYGSSVQDTSGKIKRAFDNVVVSITKVEEATAKLDSQRQVTAATAQRVTDNEEALNRALKDNADDTETITRLTNELTNSRAEHNREMQKQISLFGQHNRASQQHTSALDAVRRAQEAFNKEQGTSQGLLSAGKFISAIRAVAVPFGLIETGAILVQIAGVAASASKSLLMIPAAATAAGAAMGTLALGTAGFMDTIDQLVKGDLEKFAKNIQGLAPNAQQAALALQAVWPELTKLKDAVQDALFADVGPRIMEMANQFLPTIQQLTTGIAGAFNAAGKQIMDTLMTPESQQAIASIVNDITEAFRNLAPAMGPITEAFLTLSRVGSGVLPELANAAVRAATAFANFIDNAAKSGDLDRWIRQGLNTLGLLVQAAWELGEAFMSLAPTGEKVLPDIVRVLDKIKDIMPAIGFAAYLVGPQFGVWEASLMGVGDRVEMLETLFRKLGPVIDKAFEPLRKSLLLMKASPIGILLDKFLPNGFDPGAYASSTGMSPAGLPSGLYRRRNGSVGVSGKPNPFALAMAGIGPYPSGGFPVPPPPADKGGKGSKADDPPFYADPSLWSVDANPIGAPYGMPPGGGGQFPQWVYDLGARFGVTPSTYSGHQESNRNEPGYAPNPMGLNRGIDWSGPVENMQALADYLAMIAPMMEQVIFANPVTGQKTGIAGGNFVGDAYYGAAWAGHQNHVHTRQSTNIPLPEQLAMMQGGGLGYQAVDHEAVLRAEMSLQQAKNDVEQKRLRLLELESKGNASQRELLTARNDVTEAENKYRLADLDLQQARQGKYKELDGKVKNLAGGLGEIGAALANDFGLSEGLPGIAKWLTTFLANLAMAPALGALQAQSAASPIQGGYGMLGQMGAQNIANGLSPLGFNQLAAPGMGATGGYGASVGSIPPPFPAPSAIGPTPLGGGLGMPLAAPTAYASPAITPMTPGIGTGPDPGPVGGIGTGAGVPGMAAPPQGVQTPGLTPSTSQQPSTVGGPGFTGLGGMPMQALQMAAAAAAGPLSAIAPGAGQAAQTGIQLANRTVGYLGQLASIGIGGLMETFLPNNSEKADPAKSWIGRIASGFAGARPALPNTAGQTAPPQTPVPQQNAESQAKQPTVNIENMVNNTPDKGKSIGENIAFLQMASAGAGGPR